MEEERRAAFEVGIKLGALFHQFIGVPVSKKNAEILEKAIESCVMLQPYVVKVEVKIDTSKIKSEVGYESLSPEMLYARVEVEVNGKRAIGVLEWDEKLKYPMMKLL